MDNNQIAVSVFDKRANEYQHKYMDVSAYSGTFDIFLNSIQIKDAQILDIACGPGNISKYLLQHCPELKILGIDLSPKMIALAQLNNPGAQFAVLDCRDLSQLKRRFDAVICGFCLPYLTGAEAMKLIADAYNLLSLNGILYISLMEADSSISGFDKSANGDEIFINYHQGDFLVNALELNKFKIVHQTRLNDWDKGGTQISDLVLIARKM